MKQILIHSLQGGNNQMFNPDVRDGYNDPAIYLRDRLRQLGYDLTTADDNKLEKCEWVFFNDANCVKPYNGWHGQVWKFKKRLKKQTLFRDLYNECIQAGMQDRIVLFLWEAPSVLPQNWDPELHKLFPVIFTWHDDYIDGKKFFKIHWPQTRRFPEIPKLSFVDRKLLVNISMNKYSRHPHELYSARRASIRYFEQKYPHDFDLYGFGWNQPLSKLEKLFPFLIEKYKSYRGTVMHKWEVLPKYRFSLCYENIRDEPGWITEKIFDSIRAGCVPIYWGAPNITDYVDREAFVDRRQFKDDKELAHYLFHMTAQEYTAYQTAIKDYLNSERFSRFLPHKYADRIINALNLQPL